jgi:hypothetical protein
MALLIAPLFFLFQAAAARSDTVRSALIGVTVAGPLFLAAGAVLQWAAFDQAATDLISGACLGVPVGECTDDLIREQSTFNAWQGFTFAGNLGLVVAVVYTALQAMRVGLLTRFWGTLGMALGVSLLFLGIVGVLAFFIVLGLLIAGLWPGGRPPAWEAGVAVPWPKPGEAPAEPGTETAPSSGRARETAGSPARAETSPAAAPGPGARRRKRKRRR